MTTIRTSLARLAVLAVLAAPLPAWSDQTTDLATMQQFIEVMQGYYGIIDRIYDVASDPDKAAIQQLQKIDEFYKNRGDRAASIEVIQRVVDTAPSATVRNAAVVMLADALNETGKASQAIDVLKAAMERNLKAAR